MGGEDKGQRLRLHEFLYRGRREEVQEKREIPVQNLILDAKNPRLFEPDDIPSAIIDLLQNQQTVSGNKLLNLARDIAEHGLNLDQNLIVSPSDEGKYVVREGNRRVASIQLSTELIPFPEEFKELSSSFTVLKSQMPSVVSCLVMDDEEEINRLLQQRHTGKNNGIGIEPWDSEQRERFLSLSSGKPSDSMQIREIIKDTFGIDSDEYRISVSGIKNTNLDRFFSFADTKTHLGMSKLNGIISYNGKHDGLLSNVIKGMENKAVTDIAYNKKIASEFLQKVIENTQTENPYPTQSSFDLPTAPQQSVPVKNTHPKSAPINRKTVIPSGYSLGSKNPKFTRMVEELKRVDASQNPYAATLLLRTLINLIVEDFLIKNSVDPNSRKNAASRIDKALGIIRKKKLAENREIEYLSKICNNKNDDYPITVSTLNDAAHGLESPGPSIEALTKTWDGIKRPLEILSRYEDKDK